LQELDEGCHDRQIVSIVQGIDLRVSMSAGTCVRVLAISLVATLGVVNIERSSAPGTWTPFVAPVLPQRALGDFDGDGRGDIARIEAHSSGSRIAVRLSASTATVELGHSVVALAEGDVDRDGDIDLVAATASGDLAVFLNDGRGRFTRQGPSRGPSLSGAPILASASSETVSALGTSAPVIRPARESGSLTAIIRIRPRTATSIAASPSIGLSSLRAPPSASTVLS